MYVSIYHVYLIIKKPNDAIIISYVIYYEIIIIYYSVRINSNIK